MKEKEKQKEINSLLGSVGDERYALLVRLGKKITDYGVDKQLTAAAEGEPRPSGRENGCRFKGRGVVPMILLFMVVCRQFDSFGMGFFYIQADPWRLCWTVNCSCNEFIGICSGSKPL